MPPKNSVRRRYARYPFEKMAVGDSFLVRNPADYGVVNARLQRRHASHQGEKYEPRRVDAGIRVWRIA
jgi:hypothetical protein